ANGSGGCQVVSGKRSPADDQQGRRPGQNTAAGRSDFLYEAEREQRTLSEYRPCFDLYWKREDAPCGRRFSGLWRSMVPGSCSLWKAVRIRERKKAMKILIVGSGGREHAIAWAAAKSPKTDKIYCAPGNAGIAEFAECVDIGAMEFDKLAAFAKEKEIDLTIIGMDDPLVGGIVDVFEAEGLRVFGPRKNAAIIEGSKAFSKDLMKKYHIPTAAYENFTSKEEALAYLETAKMPIVLKADGLALGKGVLICNTLEEAKEGVKTIMEEKKFGDAGNKMVIEEFMTGREVSVLAFCDGKTVKCMTSAQDHKR